MTPNAIRCVIRSLAESAKATVSAHDFRRGCAAWLLESGMRADDVQYQLGHRTSSLTLLYGAAARQKRALAAYHAADQGVRPMRGKKDMVG